MYCSETAFAARFSSTELAELLPEDGDREYPAIAADADAQIDSYLAGRYTLPLSPVPKLIIGIAADIGRYLCYDEAAPKEVRTRRDQAIKLLEQLRDGEILIPGATPASETGGIAVSAPAISFDQCDRKDFMGCL